MKLPKKISAILGMVFLVFSALVIFGNYQSEKVPQILPVAPKIFQEDLPQTTNSNPQSEKTAQQISEKIAASIIDLNPEGPSTFESKKVIKALNPEKIADQVVKEELEKIKDLDLGLTDISVGEIKILPKLNKDSVENYLKEFQKIMFRNFAVKAGNDFDTNDLNLLIAAYEKTINEFYQLPVPAQLADIHRKQILLLSQQRIIFTKLAAAETDPLAALAAIQQSGRIGAGFSDLKKEIIEFINANNINI